MNTRDYANHEFEIAPEPKHLENHPPGGTVLSRRRFLGAAAGLAATAFLPDVADAAVGWRSSYHRRLRGYLRSRFNRTEMLLINSAVHVVANRFLDPRMVSWARPRSRRAYTQLPRGTYGRGQFYNWFNGVQLNVLRQRGFPSLNIYGQYDARGEWTGRAPVYRVVTQYRRNQAGRVYPYVAGTFSITLNTAKLGNGNLSYGRSASFWAGTIAHEMLHNLGHTHPHGVYRGVFIDAYSWAIRHNANPRARY